MFESVILIVFALVNASMPPSGVEGPVIVPGFRSLEHCQTASDEQISRLPAIEAKEHDVPADSVYVFYTCRPMAGRGA